MLDRTVKLHQREFEVLPETWAKLADAFSAVQSFISPMQSYPDINKMSERQFESFIKACRLTDWQKEELRESPDKNALYPKQIFWHDRNEAKGKAIEYNRCLLLNGIFIRPDIKAKFQIIADMMWEALVQRELNEQYDVRGLEHRDKIDRLRKEGELALKELEGIVHQRLWPAEDVTLAPGAKQ